MSNDLSAVPLTGTNSSAPFINKNNWLITSQASVSATFPCWIEAQVTKTNFVTGTYSQQGLTGNSFNGYWIAIQRAANGTTPVYEDYPYGANNSSAAASGGIVEIVKGAANGQWIVNVNGTTALTLNGYLCAKVANGSSQVYYPTAGSQANFGVESNDNAPSQTFVNNTKVTSLKVKQGNGSYLTPSSATMINGDQNTFGWKSTYTSGQVNLTK
jgi:hypothetical protein